MTYGARHYIMYPELRDNSTDPTDSGIAKKVNTMQTLQSLKDTVTNLNSLIKAAQRKVKQCENKIKKYQKYIDIINNKQTALSLLEVQHVKLLQESEQKQSLLEERLNRIINLDEIIKSISIMARTIRIQRANAKRDFWDAQSVIEDAASQLRKAGIISKGLDKLAMMNYNRPDRDFPSSVGLSDILTLSEININIDEE